MVEQQKQQQDPSAAGVAVRHSVVVQAPPERAFATFTERMGAWWPLETHTIGAKPVVDAVVEPRAGGRWYERSADGSECDWGRVLAWEPPHRVLLAWEVAHDWRHDAGLHTEVEVRFTAEDGDRTRVELEHRGLEAYGAHTDAMRATFESEGGWRGLLGRFAATTESEA
jgi:uncharacterized protein YndB with AHSA1/START domain